MIRKSVAVCLFSILFSSIVPAQQNVADSLESLLVHSDGKKKVEIYIQLGDTYQYINNERAIDFCLAGLELARMIGYKSGEANLLSGLGFHYSSIDPQKALEYSYAGLKLRKQLGNRREIAKSYNSLGNIYNHQGQYRQAISFHLKALKIREELGLKPEIAKTYNNISLIYMAIQNYDVAMEYLLKAEKIYSAISDHPGLALVKDNIGTIHLFKGDYIGALQLFQQALNINHQLGNRAMEAFSLKNIGRVYYLTGKLKGARSYLQKSLDLYEKINDKRGLASVQIYLANVFLDLGELKLASSHAERSLRFAEETGVVENIAGASEILSNVYKKLGQYKPAYEYMMKYRSVLDSINNIEKVKSVIRLEMQYNYDKMKREKEYELSREKFYNNMLIVVALFVFAFSILMFRQYKLKKQNNDLLSDLNKKLSKLNNTKDKLFSIIAHDLRNPFNGIFNSARLLAELDDTSNSEEKEVLQSIILRSAKAGYNLLENLLLWAQNQTDKIPLHPTSFSLHSIVEENVSLSEVNSKGKNITVLNEVDQSVQIFADVFSISTVIRNLISNAIKFTHPGGKVTISCEKENGFINVMVTDTGIGMSEEDISKLFRSDEFFSSSGTNKERGSGLGLLLCREFIESNNGTLSVKSQLGVGSTFIFTLPEGCAEITKHLQPESIDN